MSTWVASVAEFGGDAAFPHDQDAIGNAQYLGKVGGDDKNGGAGFGKIADQAMDFFLGPNVHALGGFGQDEQFRSGEQLAGNDHLLGVSAGHGTDGLVFVGGLDAQAA